MLSEMWTKKDFDKIIKVIDKIYTYSLILVLPISILVFMFPELILSILFGEKFIPASSVLRILSFLIILQVLIKFNNSILIGTGFTNELPKYLITGGVLNIIGNLCLIPFFGLEGAAYSTLFAFSFIFLVSTYKVNKILNLNLNFKKYLKIIFLSSLFMILVVFFRNIMLFNELLNSIFSVLIGFSIYIFLVYKLNIVNLKEIYNLSK